jgi:hypothetical protein
MTYIVILEDENGAALERVEDPKDALRKALSESGNGNYPFLRTIDPYGDTVFNRPQMEPSLHEWRSLMRTRKSDKEQKVLQEVERLANRCQDETHLYLRFQGD